MFALEGSIVKVTAQQLKDACARGNITSIPNHECCICGVPVGYLVHTRTGNLWWDGSCDCCSASAGVEPSSWDAAAAWVNMQTNETLANRIAARFGIHTEEVQS